MKISTVTRHIFPAGVLGLLVMMPPTASVILRAEDKTAPTAAPSPFAKALVGTWVLVGKPGE
jgi:hypothetical protein